jgi:N-methylhydantoinase A
LRAGDALAGPAVIEQYDATTYVAPGWSARIDAISNLVLERI